MTHDDQQPPRMNRPVLNGLVALLAVAIAVGLIVSGVALVGVKYLGLGDDGGGTKVAGDGQSAIIPKPERTTESGPRVTLATDSSSSASSEATDATTEPEESESADEGEITLSAGQTQVVNFGRIDLTGLYPGGEGVVLQVQRLQDGEWVDFGVTVAVIGGAFTTYVQTGIEGANKFRVLDRDTETVSNVVRVTVG